MTRCRSLKRSSRFQARRVEALSAVATQKPLGVVSRCAGRSMLRVFPQRVFLVDPNRGPQGCRQVWRIFDFQGRHVLPLVESDFPWVDSIPVQESATLPNPRRDQGVPRACTIGRAARGEREQVMQSGHAARRRLV